MKQSTQSGFTLVELAVVLAIIALITGGIVAGERLLHNADLRDVHTRAETYISAVEKFQEKYDTLPGDMYNAIDIWGPQDTAGDSDGAGADCTDSASSSPATCNGDGDGFIADDAASAYEAFRVWQHLRNAELIDGAYTGARASTATNWHTDVGTNVPRSQYRNDAGYGMRYELTNASHYAESLPGLYLIHGQETSNNYNDAGAMLAEDAWSIDRKIDDGLPGQGKVVTYDNTALSDCATTDAAATAVYDLDNDEPDACVLNFRMDF